jgi:hypothetical protein
MVASTNSALKEIGRIEEPIVALGLGIITEAYTVLILLLHAYMYFSF